MVMIESYILYQNFKLRQALELILFNTFIQFKGRIQTNTLNTYGR